MNDKSIMPFGMHKGKTLANVPAKYLLYLYNTGIAKGDLKQYITENLEVLNDEVKRGTTYTKRS